MSCAFVAQVRLYRVRWFFRYLEYDLTVSLLTVTVARNLVIVLYLTHWVACGFNFLARSGGYDPDLLVGLNPELFASISLPEQYVYSLYWSVTTLAGACLYQRVTLQLHLQSTGLGECPNRGRHKPHCPLSQHSWPQ